MAKLEKSSCSRLVLTLRRALIKSRSIIHFPPEINLVDWIIMILPSGGITMMPGGGLFSYSCCWLALHRVSTGYMNLIMSGTFFFVLRPDALIN